MYIYFLPLPTFNSDDPSLSHIGPLPRGGEALIPLPTHDGGIEHTAARFFPSHTWLDMARSGEIILFPPQFFLLTMVARYLTPTRQDAYTNIDLLRQRRALEAFARAGQPTPWADVCVSPMFMGSTKDGKTVLSMTYPGDEVKDQGRKGLEEYVIMMDRTEKGMPANVDIRLRKDVQKVLSGKL
jgi:hypothetical protein